MSFEAEKAKDLKYYQADDEFMSDPRNWPNQSNAQTLKSANVSTDNNVENNECTTDAEENVT